MNYPKFSLVLILFLFSCKETMIILPSSWFFQIDRFDEMTCPEGRRVSNHTGVGLVLKHETLNIKNIDRIFLSGAGGFEEVLTIDRFDKKSNRIFYYMRGKFSKEKHFESMSFRPNSLDLIVYPKSEVLNLLKGIKVKVFDRNGKSRLFLVPAPVINAKEREVEIFIPIKLGENQYEINAKISQKTKLIVEYKKNGSHFLEEKLITNKQKYVKIEPNVEYLAFQLIKDGIGFVTENKIEVFKECEHF